MRNNIYIILFVLLLCNINIAQAQVTVGSGNPPESFSCLQLDGTLGGFQLPRLSKENRDGLGLEALGSSLAAGLLVYNTNKKMPNYWNGASWSNLGKTTHMSNGLMHYPTMGLAGMGGALVKNTNISQGTYLFSIVTGDGVFSVDSELFKLTNKKLGIRVSDFSVGNVFTLNKGATETTLQMQADVIIENALGDKLSVAADKVKIDKKFVFQDGKQAEAKVLTVDALKQAYWAVLRPDTEVVTGTLFSNVSANFISGTSTSLEYKNITQEEIVLKPGKWMVFADYVAVCNYTNRTTEKAYLWTYLCKKDSKTTREVVTVEGVNTSNTTASGTTSILRRSFAQLFYIVDISEETTFWIEAATENRNVSLDPSLGSFNFYAVSIIKMVNKTR